jgi:subtilisin family serine protease
MKKLLYGVAGLALAGLLTYFNLETIVNRSLASEIVPPDPSPEFPYFINEFVVNFTNDTIKNNLIKKRLTDEFHLHRLNSCGCDSKIELWGNESDIEVGLDPENEPPKGGTGLLPSPISVIGRYSIARNYKLIEEFLPDALTRASSIPEPIGGPIVNPNSEVKIAVIDTGVDTTEGVLKPFLWTNTVGASACTPPFKEGYRGLNFLNTALDISFIEPQDKDGEVSRVFPFTRVIKHGHGTLINGIIAGVSNYARRGTFRADTSVKMKILNIKFAEKHTTGRRPPRGSLFQALCGIHYALSKDVKIINASWHISPVTNKIGSIARIFDSTLVKIVNKKAILVTSSGNNKLRKEDETLIFPAQFSRYPEYSNNVISVGAWNTGESTFVPSSNRGKWVDVYAPGKSIGMSYLVSRTTDFFKPQTGTSFATPFVVREVAQIMGRNPRFTPAEVKRKLIGGCIDTALPSDGPIKIFMPSR